LVWGGFRVGVGLMLWEVGSCGLGLVGIGWTAYIGCGMVRGKACDDLSINHIIIILISREKKKKKSHQRILFDTEKRSK
jgi:hypothetical protein